MGNAGDPLNTKLNINIKSIQGGSSFIFAKLSQQYLDKTCHF